MPSQAPRKPRQANRKYVTPLRGSHGAETTQPPDNLALEHRQHQDSASGQENSIAQSHKTTQSQRGRRGSTSPRTRSAANREGSKTWYDLGQNRLYRDQEDGLENTNSERNSWRRCKDPSTPDPTTANPSKETLSRSFQIISFFVRSDT